MAKRPEIEHVSDTALWVATYRAEESERPDALFRDPFARELAGERGREIARTMPGSRIVAWVLSMRTSVIDRMVLRAVNEGADLVLNLGAGLDARPYRLDLPPELRWTEVDFPAMVSAKNDRLKGRLPRCKLERIGCDLSNADERRSLLARLASECRNAVVITEGVIFYLSSEEASDLAADLRAHPSFRRWIQDYRNGGIARARPGKWREIFKSAPLKFEEEDWFGFFAQRGWAVEESVTHFAESERAGRAPPIPWWARALFYLSPRAKRDKILNSAGVVMFRR